MIEAMRRKGQRVLASSARRSAAQRDLPPAADRKAGRRQHSATPNRPPALFENGSIPGQTVEARKAIAAPGRRNSSACASAGRQPRRLSKTVDLAPLEDVQTIAAALRTEPATRVRNTRNPVPASLASPTASLARPAGRAALLWRRPALPSCWSRRSYFFFAAGLAAAFGAAFAAGLAAAVFAAGLAAAAFAAGFLAAAGLAGAAAFFTGAFAAAGFAAGFFAAGFAAALCGFGAAFLTAAFTAAGLAAGFLAAGFAGALEIGFLVTIHPFWCCAMESRESKTVTSVINRK